MSDPITRMPVVGPTYPVKPAQPVREGGEQKRPRGQAPRPADVNDEDDATDSDAEEHATKIDEYI